MYLTASFGAHVNIVSLLTYLLTYLSTPLFAVMYGKSCEMMLVDILLMTFSAIVVV